MGEQYYRVQYVTFCSNIKLMLVVNFGYLTYKRQPNDLSDKFIHFLFQRQFSLIRGSWEVSPYKITTIPHNGKILFMICFNIWYPLCRIMEYSSIITRRLYLHFCWKTERTVEDSGLNYVENEPSPSL